MNKSLSIIIPVYNEESQLEACLRSIEAQTVQPDEVIVVDNNSADRSMEVARRFPFVTIIHEAKQGVVYARDTGFNTASSDIICRIDGDTVLPKNWLSRVRRFYEGGHHDNFALTGGGYFYNIPMPRFNGWLQSQLILRLNRATVGYYILWGSNMALPRHQWLRVRDAVCHRNDIHEDLDLSFHLHDQDTRITYRASLRVGVNMKRVLSGRKYLRGHMDRWPQSLRVHGFKRWPWLLLVNWLLWYVVQPIGFLVEYGARLCGKRPYNS